MRSRSLVLPIKKRFYALLKFFRFHYAEYAATNLALPVNNDCGGQDFAHIVLSGKLTTSKDNRIVHP